MSYTVIVEPHCEKALRKIAKSDRTLYKRFDEKINELSNNPYPADVFVLHHTEEYDLCRTKIGQKWRLIFGIMDRKMIVLILDAVSREGAYEDLDLLAIRLERQLEDLDTGSAE